MKNKLTDILKECETIICKIIDNEIQSFNINALIKGKKVSSSDIEHIKKGIYLFSDDDNNIVYIGQGGVQPSTPLKKRILQELKNYQKTDNGNNGATLSKNIQSKDKINFDSTDNFIKHINNWKIKILDCNKMNIHIDILESICIELYNPKYNIKGKE
jgi:excinuclease UvrABC nuclease subunit